MNKLGRWFVLTVFLVSTPVLALGMGQSPFVKEDALLGQPAKEFTLPTLGGQTMSLTEMRAGSGAIMFFWATWCPHCRRTLSDIDKAVASIRAKGIKVILVDVGEDADTVRAYFKRNNMQFDCFLDGKSAVAEQYQLIGVPTFFLLNKDGVVKFVDHYFPDNYAELISK